MHDRHRRASLVVLQLLLKRTRRVNVRAYYMFGVLVKSKEGVQMRTRIAI